MFSKETPSGAVRTALPILAIVIAYVLFDAVPGHHQRQQLAVQTQQTAAAVEMLRARIAAQPNERPQHIVQTIANHGVAADTNAAVTGTVDAPNQPPTAVAAFAQVLSIFRSHGVLCTAATPQTESAALAYRVTLQGEFHDVLSAMHQLVDQLPHAVASDFSMQRPPSATGCQWQFTFRFIPEIQ